MIDEKILIGGYSEKVFNDNPEIKDIEGFIYLLKIGNLYKIGISRISTSSRVKSLKSSSKQKVIVLKSIKMNLYKAFKIEQSLLEEFKYKRIFKDLSTELFSEDITNNFLIKINEYEN